jgi:hypothetical protein
VLTEHEIDLEILAGNGAGYHPRICCESVIAWVKFERDEASIISIASWLSPSIIPENFACLLKGIVDFRKLPLE